MLGINSSNLFFLLSAILFLWFYVRTRKTKPSNHETHSDNDDQTNYGNDNYDDLINHGNFDDHIVRLTLTDLANGEKAWGSANFNVLVFLVDLASDFEDDDAFYDSLDTPLSDKKIEKILHAFRKYSPIPSDGSINYALYRQEVKKKILEIKQRMKEDELLDHAFEGILENFSKELIYTIFDDSIYVAIDDKASEPVVERLKLYGISLMLENDLIMSKITSFINSPHNDTATEYSAEPTDSKEPMIEENLSLEEAYKVIGASKDDTDTDIVYACRKKLRKLNTDAILALTNEDKLKVEKEIKLVEKAKEVLMESGIDFEEV